MVRQGVKRIAIVHRGVIAGARAVRSKRIDIELRCDHTLAGNVSVDTTIGLVLIYYGHNVEHYLSNFSQKKGFLVIIKYLC